MPLTPDEIDAVHLPRATVGGYKARPTADLLNRVSWDYRQIVHQHGVVVEEAKQLRARVAELEQELQGAKQAADERRGLDELARDVLATARRAARELREAANIRHHKRSWPVLQQGGDGCGARDAFVWRARQGRL